METFGAIQDRCTLDWIYHVQWPKQNKRYDLRFYWRIQPLVFEFKFYGRILDSSVCFETLVSDFRS